MEENKSKIRSLDAISLNDILRAFLKYFYIVAAGLLAGAIIGLMFFVREYRSPKAESYSAEATMSVITTNTDGKLIDNASELDRSISDINSSQSLSSNVTVLAQSNYVIDKVVTQLGDLSIDSKSLKSSITVTPVEKTMFLTVSIKWPERDQSIALVNGMMEVLPGAMDEKLGLGSVLVVDYATDAVLSVSPHNYTSAYISPLIGLVVGFITAFLMYAFNLKVNDSDEISEYLTLNTLAEIPYFRRRNCHKLLNEENVSTEYREAYSVLASVLNYICVKDKYKVLYVTSAVSGEGKTTLSINLSISLTEKSKRVLLIDSDIKRPVISTLLDTGCEKPPFEDVINGFCDYTDAIYNIGENLDFIRAQYSDLMPDSELLKKVLDSLRGHYDYIIIDTPPIGLVADAFSLNSCVDGMLYVIRQDFAGFGVVADSINSAKNAGANIIGAVLNARHHIKASSYYSKSKYYNKYYGKYGYSYNGYNSTYNRRGAYYRRGKENSSSEAESGTAQIPANKISSAAGDNTVNIPIEAAVPISKPVASEVKADEVKPTVQADKADEKSEDKAVSGESEVVPTPVKVEVVDSEQLDKMLFSGGNKPDGDK